MGEYADMAVDDALNGYWDDPDDDGWFGSRPRSPRSATPGSPLAKARMRAHQALDPLWLSGQMSRSQAYRWLALEMGIPKSQCHMLQFSEEQCRETIRICRLESLRREDG